MSKRGVVRVVARAALIGILALAMRLPQVQAPTAALASSVECQTKVTNGITDLTGCDLSSYTFTGVDLTGYTFVDANLTNANFTNAVLDNADFTGANLYGANFTGAYLDTGPNFTNAILTYATLKPYQNNLATATLTGVKSGNLVISGTYTLPTNWSFAKGHLVGPGANLTGADLGWVNFSNRTLTNVNFTDADLTGAYFSNANFSGSNFTGASLVYTELLNTNFTGANFTNADFTLARMGSLVNLTNATLTGSTFVPSERYLPFATLTGVRSGNMTVSGNYYLPTGWRILAGYLIGPGANLTGANLSTYDLTNADMTNANLTNVNFTGTYLQNAKLAGATLTGITWSNTTCPNGLNSNNLSNTCASALATFTPTPTVTSSPTITPTPTRTRTPTTVPSITFTPTQTSTATPPPAAAGSISITNTGDWIATGQYVAAGQSISIRFLSGQIGGWAEGDAPGGLAPCPYALDNVSTSVPCSALVARIGTNTFLVGNNLTIQGGQHPAGDLSIGYNLDWVVDGGSWSVGYSVFGTPAPATSTPSPTPTQTLTPTPTRTLTPTITPTRTPSPAPASSGEKTVTNTGDWIDTGLTLGAGQDLYLALVDGAIDYETDGVGVGSDCWFSNLSWADLMPCRSLVVRIGDNVFFVGSDRTIAAEDHSGGKIYLGYNSSQTTYAGSWTVDYDIFGTPWTPTITPTATQTFTPTATFTPRPTSVGGQQTTVTNTGGWIDTGVDVPAGQWVHVLVIGGLMDTWNGGDGSGNCPSASLPDATTKTCIALLAKIGTSVFDVGAQESIPPGNHTGGRLYLAYNLGLVGEHQGSWLVDYVISSGTATATLPPTMTPTRTATPTVTNTATVTATSTNTATPTVTLTPSATPSATLTRTPSATATSTSTATTTLTPTATPTSTRTQTATATSTVTVTTTPSRTATPSRTPTSTRTPSLTPTSSATRSPSPTRTVTRTPTSTRTATFTRTPTSTRTATVTRTPTATRTPPPVVT